MQTDDVGFTLLDLKKPAYQNDPFIMAEQAKHVFYVQNPCDERWSVVLHGKTIGVNVEDDDSYIDTYVSPLSIQMSPNIVGEEEADDTRKATRLRSLATRPAGADRPVVHLDPVIEKADGPHEKKLRTYLGIVARDKVDMTYENWNQVPAAQKDLIWEDIQVEFDIPEASDVRTKKKILQTVGERWRQFKYDLTSKWALAADKDRCAEKGTGHPEAKHCPPRVVSWGYEYLEKKLMAEKTKKKLEEAAQSGSIETVIDPPSPIRRHVKWKMARTKKTSQMTSKAANEIAKKIDSLEEQASQEHLGRVRVVGAGVTIKQYFGPAPRTSRTSSSLPPEELEQLTQQIRDQLEESITEKGLALPLEPEVGPSTTRVSTRKSCVDPSGNDPDTGDSDKYELYREENPPRLVSLGKVYEGSTTVHTIPLLHDQVKVGVEEVRDADAPIPVPTKEVKLVGQTLNTFLAWPTHLLLHDAMDVNYNLWKFQE
ncbi:hypothetical protein GmHk_20G057102 [Glycine max]|nr:hypothetical protein GmHk_20G057102 [Glycine max]